MDAVHFYKGGGNNAGLSENLSSEYFPEYTKMAKMVYNAYYLF